MPTVNLAPGTEYLLTTRRRQRTLFTIAAAGALLIGIIWLILIGISSSVRAEIDQAEGRLRSVETQIAKLSETADRIQLFENRLSALSQLLNQHTRWDPILAEVERLLPPGARIKNFATKLGENQIAIAGSTLTLDEIAQTVASLEDEDQHTTLFSEINIDNIQRQAVGTAESSVLIYEFSATFKFDPSAVLGDTRPESL